MQVLFLETYLQPSIIFGIVVISLACFCKNSCQTIRHVNTNTLYKISRTTTEHQSHKCKSDKFSNETVIGSDREYAPLSSITVNTCIDGQ